MTVLSILAVPGIMLVAGGSVLLISKIGGKQARKNISDMKGTVHDDPQRS